ncbi:Rv2175c family DNA-binding protein [Luteipulveratus sp. YIM 133132]|uniref:Rv2175c family DNA-binding protein n=1 Tax=Luteipulveratus flavus TaxID=3031728 RepID=UPI0023B10295|nr:Rv2175c family DNA-binding protein [Luteipulveratus sp. YIM 133132]MDE9366770.1 Rv2175c family DNA-binding protein [Luteipulveratus sp. YIM 133132]
MTDDANDRTLERLVGDWLTVPDLAEALDLPLRKVRQMIADRELLAHRVGERDVVAVPAQFVLDGAVLPNLGGTITVLGDAGLSDDEALIWLFTPDPTLPIEGAPVHMLIAGRRAEVRKRAQELAF